MNVRRRSIPRRVAPGSDQAAGDAKRRTQKPSGREAESGGDTTLSPMSWAERAAERSPVVQRSRSRGIEQAKSIVAAARRLIALKGAGFTTQELVKEARVALQTFYRYFPSKDQLLLAVIEDILAESCAGYEQRARSLSDPIARLRFYIFSALSALDGAETNPAGPRFITTEHWRLHQLFPEELHEARKPFQDLILREVIAGAEAGLLKPADPEYQAWLITELVTVTFHYYAFAPTVPSAEEVTDRVLTFCLNGLGGQPEPGGRRETRPRRERM